MDKVLKKYALAAVFALAFALAALPGAAFADSFVAAQADAGGLDVYMQVQVGVDEEGNATYSDAQLLAALNKDDIAAMAAANTDVYGYMYSGKKGTSVMAATNYVTVAQVLEAANVQMAEGDKLHFTCTDGDYGKFEATAADLSAENKFFPAYAGGTDYDATGAEAAPAVLAFGYGSAGIDSTAGVAKGAAQAAAAANDYAKFCIGETEAQYVAEGLRPGNNFPTDVMAITVLKPADNAQLSVFACDQSGTDADGNATYGDAKLVKTFTKAELKELAGKNSDAYGYMYNGKKGLSVLAAKSYVSVDQVAEAADIEMIDGDKIHFTCTDGDYGKFEAAAADLMAENMFFPAYVGGTDYDPSNAEAAPAVFAYCYGSDSTTPAGTGKANALAAASDSEFAKFCIGETEAQYVAEGPRPGNNFPTDVLAVTFCMASSKDISGATMQFPKASVAYTGKNIEQVPTISLDGVDLVEDRNFTLSFKANKKVGTATVTAKGIGRYTGSVSATFDIVKAAQTIAAKNVSKSFTGKKAGKTKTLAKTKSFTLKASAKSKVVFAKANKKGGAKITVGKSGKVTVKKGLKKGTYKVKVKLTAAEGKYYKAAKAKTITVTVKVK